MDNFKKLQVYKTLTPSLGMRVKYMLSKAISWNDPNLTYLPFVNFPVNMSGGQLATEMWNKQNGILTGYSKNEAVYAIVSKIAKTCSYAPWYAYKIEDEKAYDTYQAMIKQPFTEKNLGNILRMRNKAMRQIADGRLNELLKYPNAEQSCSEYIETLVSYKLITGDMYEWARLLDSGNNAGKPYEFNALPSQFVKIYVDNSVFPLEVLKYEIEENKRVEFSPQEVLHAKYFNPNFSFTGTHLYGFSPLQAGWISALQDNESKRAAMEILQNRGVRGVLSLQNPNLKTQQMANEQAGRLKERWRQENIENRGGIVPVAGKADWVSVGMSPSDMEILKTSEYTLDDLCNIYGVSSVLFNSRTNSKYDNFEQARKDFIINSILPILNQFKDARNRKLRTDWGYNQEGIVVDYDISGFVELQQDLAKQSEWLDRSWWLTPNERRAYMREVELNDTLMDKIYIPSDMVPLDEQNITFDGNNE